MSPDPSLKQTPEMTTKTRSSKRMTRTARIAATLGLTVFAWLGIALTASAEDPSASASAAPSAEVTPAPSLAPTPSHPVIPTPGPSDDGWLFATSEPSFGPPAATAPPLPSMPVHTAANGANSCYDCHSAVNDKQATIAAQWKDSAHGKGGIGCADCHGGDPTSDQITKAMDPAAGFSKAPDRQGTVGLCGSCHANPTEMKASGLPTDQYAKYWTSVHGQRLVSAGDTRVAICSDCHGVHDIKKVSDPSAKTFALNIPKLCAGCHADAQRMAPYGIPTDQFDVYSKSVHGVALLENKDVRAPSCVGCHGSHDAQPPTSTTVVEVCGKCHTATQDLYGQSRHSELSAAAPKCWTCHGTHDVSQPSSAMFFHDTPPNYTCDTCHDLTTHKLRLELSRFAKAEDRRCDTCHHPDSEIYAQIQGIATAITGAETAYADADAAIERAAGFGMLTDDADVALVGAKTSLIQAQAAIHTTKLKTVAELSADARQKAGDAQALAQSKIDESVFRREAMVIVIGLILACVVFLYMLKRKLDKELD
ncbi:MAG: cytochrome c3 family protein [Chloroflexota bacterium]